MEPTTWLRSKERAGCGLRRRGLFGGRWGRHMSSSEHLSARMMDDDDDDDGDCIVVVAPDSLV